MKKRNTKGEKWTRVLALIRQKGGAIATDDPDLVALLGGVLYRLPTYITYIRRSGVPVRAIRATDKPAMGRRHVARYELGETSSHVEEPNISQQRSESGSAAAQESLPVRPDFA